MIEYNEDEEDPEWDGNSILAPFSERLLSNPKYMFIGDFVNTFETLGDNIVKLASNMEYICVPIPIAYGEKNVYYFKGRYKLTTVDSLYSLNDENVRRKVSEVDKSNDTYGFL